MADQYRATQKDSLAPHEWGRFGIAAAHLGDRPTALAALAALESAGSDAESDGAADDWRAMVLAALGDGDESVQLLDQTRQRFAMALRWHVQPEFVRLRSVPRIDALVQQRR